MKVYLDDIRAPYEGWVRAFSALQAIELLKTGNVTELSLDHDLSEREGDNGYAVLLWIEEQVVLNNFHPPILHVHTANPSARVKMELAVQNIIRLAQQQQERL